MPIKNNYSGPSDKFLDSIAISMNEQQFFIISMNYHGDSEEFCLIGK